MRHCILSNFQTMCVRVIPTLNFRAKTWYVWLSIFGKTSFPAMLKNQSFWPIASAFFCKLTKLLNANPSSPWVLQNLASSCLFPRDEKTLSLSSTTDFSSIFQSCAALGEILQSRINPLSWKKTHFDTLAFSKNRNHSKVETYCLPKIAAHQKWVFNRKAENDWDETFLAN